MVDTEIKQEVEQISKERNIENLNREKSRFNENIKTHENLLEKLNKDREANNKKYEAMFKEGNWKIIAPVWEFEKDEDYLTAMKLDAENKRAFDKHNFDQNEKQIKEVILKQKEQVDSIEKELERLTKGE